MKKLHLFILVIAFSLILVACNRDDNPQNTNGEHDINLLKADALNNDQLIKWLGRTHYDTNTQQHYFYHTASGFSVTFEGTSLQLNIHATNTHSDSLRPYFSVLINDQNPNEGSVIHLSQPTSTIVLVDNLDYGIHTVTFLKRSEARDALTSISHIETDGRFMKPQLAFDMNILILGGSGVSGNGVFGGPGIQRTTENSSSLNAFGYQVANTVNANVQFVASSGWGLKWGHNPTNANGTINIRTAFEKIGINDNQELIDISFDPQSFIPDFIIINLGGNDYTSTISNLIGEEKTIAEKLFQEAVLEIVTTLNTHYPNAFIFWTHTGSINGALASTVLSDLDPLRNFVEVVVIDSPGTHNDPIGSNNHASEVTHQRNADILVAKIHEQRDKDN